MSVEQNKINIARNRRLIFETECQVQYNRTQAYVTRSLIEGNTALIRKNYAAAFLGNRQLANGNTDDLFRNRLALIKAAPVSGAVQENFKEALTNATKLDYLEHRSGLNAKVIEISQTMASINTQLAALNRQIMEANQAIVEFNSAQINKNSALLASGIGAESATPESNAKLIASNAARAAAVQAKAAENKKTLHDLHDQTTGNYGRIIANAKEIDERRQAIAANHQKIAANQKAVAERIFKE